MTHRSTDQLLEELRQRAIRTESRVVQLGDHMGANLRSAPKLAVYPADAHNAFPWVEIDSLDVSISRILAAVKAAELKPRAITVFHGERAVCTLNLTNLEPA